MKNPKVSIIIPTKNSEIYFERCLQSIKNQSYKNIEIIIVDNHSQDNTTKIGNKFTSKIYTHGNERSEQRNIGTKMAKGKYVVFIDSDMELEKTVIGECIKMCKKSNSSIAITIPEKPIATKYWEKVKAFEREIYRKQKDAKIEAPRWVSKAVIDDIGGYDQYMTGAEDWDLAVRIKNAGIETNRIKSSILHHENINSIQELWKKKVYQGIGMERFLSKHRISLISDRSIYIFRSVFYKSWRNFLKNKEIILPFIWMLTVGQIAGSYGVMLGKLTKKTRAEVKLNILKKFPKISFIIPTYNAEKYLAKCIESITKQQYPKKLIEIIIIDGGSTDKTVKIAKKYTKKIFKNKEKIAEYGKAIGIKKSTGKFFILIDSDNEIIQTDWLTKMVAPILEQPNLIGVESPLSWDKKLSSLNRYFARMRISDPFAKYLVSKPYQVIDIGKYDIFRYPAQSTVLTGANGFLWNRPLLKKMDTWGNRFEESYYPNNLHKFGGIIEYAVPKGIAVRHYYADNIKEYISKRDKIAKKIVRKVHAKDFIWLSNISIFRTIMTIIYIGTVIGPTVEAILRAIKDKSVDWLWHPLISIITIAVYSKRMIILIKEKIL